MNTAESFDSAIFELLNLARLNFKKVLKAAVPWSAKVYCSVLRKDGYFATSKRF